MIVRGSLERLSPVLMTALVTAFALAPLLLEAERPGTEILHPVAVVIFSGLISSTPLDTFLTRPCSGCLAARMPNACWTTRTPKRSEICFFIHPLKGTLMKTTANFSPPWPSQLWPPPPPMPLATTAQATTTSPNTAASWPKPTTWTTNSSPNPTP